MKSLDQHQRLERPSDQESGLSSKALGFQRFQPSVTELTKPFSKLRLSRCPHSSESRESSSSHERERIDGQFEALNQVREAFTLLKSSEQAKRVSPEFRSMLSYATRKPCPTPMKGQRKMRKEGQQKKIDGFVTKSKATAITSFFDKLNLELGSKRKASEISSEVLDNSKREVLSEFSETHSVSNAQIEL